MISAREMFWQNQKRKLLPKKCISRFRDSRIRARQRVLSFHHTVRLDERRERVVVEQFQPTAAAHSHHAPTRVCSGRDEVWDQALAPLLLEVKVPAVVPARAQTLARRVARKVTVVLAVLLENPGRRVPSVSVAGVGLVRNHHRGDARRGARFEPRSRNPPTERARLEGVAVGVEVEPLVQEPLFAARVVVRRRAKQVLQRRAPSRRKRLSHDRDRVGRGLFAAHAVSWGVVATRFGVARCGVEASEGERLDARPNAATLKKS